MLRQGVNADGELMRDFYVIHDPVNVYCDPKEGKTRQEDAEAADINVLMARYERTGVLPLGDGSAGQYIDLTSLPLDYREALDMVSAAGAAFAALPAAVRKEFDNDPAKFVDFASDPKNIDRMREFGLAPKKEEDAPKVVVEQKPSDAPAKPA